MENKRIAIVSCRQAVHPLLLGEKSKSTREQERRDFIAPCHFPPSSLLLPSICEANRKPLRQKKKKKFPQRLRSSLKVLRQLFSHVAMATWSVHHTTIDPCILHPQEEQDKKIRLHFLFSLSFSLCIFLTGADEMGRILFRRPFYSAADGAGCDDEEQHPAAEQQEFDCETDKDVGRSASRLHSAADVAAADDRSRRIGSHNVAVQRFEKIADV